MRTFIYRALKDVFYGFMNWVCCKGRAGLLSLCLSMAGVKSLLRLEEGSVDSVLLDGSCSR